MGSLELGLPGVEKTTVSHDSLLLDGLQLLHMLCPRRVSQVGLCWLNRAALSVNVVGFATSSCALLELMDTHRLAEGQLVQRSRLGKRLLLDRISQVLGVAFA